MKGVFGGRVEEMIPCRLGGGPEIPVTVSVIGPTFVFSVSGLKANCSGEEARLLGKSRPIRSLASNNNNKKNCSAWELPHRGGGAQFS